jgi:hypothetical protein
MNNLNLELAIFQTETSQILYRIFVLIMNWDMELHYWKLAQVN